MNHTPSRSILMIGLLTAILAASTASIFIRLAQAQGAASIVIAAARLTIASLVLAPLALSRHRTALQQLARGEWMLALLSGIFLAFHFATWISSLQYTTVASSAVLVSTTPLWVALLAPLVLHEQAGKWAMVGMFLALAGGIIVALSDTCSVQAGSIACPALQVFLGGKAFLGDLLALLGAWMAAAYMLVGRKLRAKMDLVPYIFIVYGMAALVLIVIMLAMGKSPLGYPPAAWLWFVLLAFIPQLFGHTMYNWSLKYVPASFVSITLLGEPIGSTILAVIIFQETPGWVKLLGAVLILAGIWMSSRSGKNEPASGQIPAGSS